MGQAGLGLRAGGTQHSLQEMGRPEEEDGGVGREVTHLTGVGPWLVTAKGKQWGKAVFLQRWSVRGLRLIQNGATQDLSAPSPHAPQGSLWGMHYFPTGCKRTGSWVFIPGLDSKEGGKKREWKDLPIIGPSHGLWLHPALSRVSGMFPEPLGTQGEIPHTSLRPLCHSCPPPPFSPQLSRTLEQVKKLCPGSQSQV